MTQIKPDEALNLTGVVCPGNSIRTILKLEGMESGSILEIIIDDGEPIKNVPPTVKEEGHKIINVAKTNNQWKLLIKRV